MTLHWQTPRERDLERECQRLQERLRQAEARTQTALALLRTVTVGTELEGVEAGVSPDSLAGRGKGRG